MRCRQILSSAIVIMFGLATASTSALATNTREAIKMCDKNPKCQMDVGKDGVVISVGGSLIVCPIKNGPCGVARNTGHHPGHVNEGGNAQQQRDGSGGGGETGGAPGGSGGGGGGTIF